MQEIIVLSIFPEIINSYLHMSILGRALDNHLFKLQVIDIRDFTTDKHRKVDDEPFGGGAGMVMKPEPLFTALESLKIKPNDKVIFPTPTAKVFNQEQAKQYASHKGRLIFICGRYEGIDQRVVDYWVTDEVSLGNFVVTGGELPTLMIIDSTLRMVTGVVGKQESIINDSFYNGNDFDHPHYTRPSEFRDLKVPDVLLNGNHKHITDWRKDQATTKRNTIS